MADFVCPICHSEDFFSVSVRADFFSVRDVEPRLFICNGCSVVFQDPSKFSSPISQLYNKQSQLRLLALPFGESLLPPSP